MQSSLTIGLPISNDKLYNRKKKLQVAKVFLPRLFKMYINYIDETNNWQFATKKIAVSKIW